VFDWINGLEPNVLINAGLELTLAEASDWKWKYTHVLTVKEITGHLIRTLVGIGNTPDGIQFPMNQNIDNETKESIRLAWKLAETGSTGAAFWPMLSFENNNWLIYGRSMGLPSYLAFKSFDSDKSIHSVIATGEIDHTGKVLPVKGLCEKFETARSHGFPIFLYPEPEQGDALLTQIDAFEPVPVQNLEEAEAILRFNTPQTSNKISRITRSNNSEEIISLILETPIIYLRYLETKNSKISQSIQDENINVNALKNLLDNISDLMKKCPLPLETLSFVFDIFTKNITEKYTHYYPEISYKICSRKIQWLNFIGNTYEAHKWECLRKNIIESEAISIIASDIEEINADINKNIISNFHNTYYFKPDMPDHFLETLEELQRTHERLRKISPGAPYKQLGRYYGTITQNYAFCGPKYIDKVISFAQKAQNAFGNFPSEKEEVFRIYSYLIYAFLDAKQHQDAEQYLYKYLEADILALNVKFDLISNPYAHAAIARFFADTNKVTQNYLEFIKTKIHKREQSHPWQLWYYNIGRILKHTNLELAKKCFEYSLDICISDIHGHTVKAMALLPLSALIDISPQNNHAFILQNADYILRTIKNSNLHLEHFHPLLSAIDCKSSLKIVQAETHTFFPFTYR